MNAACCFFFSRLFAEPERPVTVIDTIQIMLCRHVEYVDSLMNKALQTSPTSTIGLDIPYSCWLCRSPYSVTIVFGGLVPVLLFILMR